MDRKYARSNQSFPLLPVQRSSVAKPPVKTGGSGPPPVPRDSKLSQKR